MHLCLTAQKAGRGVEEMEGGPRDEGRVGAISGLVVVLLIIDAKISRWVLRLLHRSLLVIMCLSVNFFPPCCSQAS